MTYRDPREALQAENDCLRQELRETQDELAAARTVPPGQEYERRRWALGMRCLGSLAMVAPFLAMMTLCEQRAMHRAHHYSPTPATPAAHLASLGGCPMAEATRDFKRFSDAVERTARVTESTHAAIPTGTACTVRIDPVSMVQFNCHVSVVCGGNEVYGTMPTGYAHCDVDQGRVILAVDPHPTHLDGDPAITADLASGRVLIEDSNPANTSRLTLALSQPATR